MIMFLSHIHDIMIGKSMVLSKQNASCILAPMRGVIINIYIHNSSIFMSNVKKVNFLEGRKFSNEVK